MANEMLLKYGCNPNQKPSKVFMEDGKELPITVLNGKPGYINLLDAFNGWQLVRSLKRLRAFAPQPLSSTFHLRVRLSALP
jgi:AICAR transformylase/IMP cyclohydrolase PurH (only IMP cyclohydrolase domain in Aful)